MKVRETHHYWEDDSGEGWLVILQWVTVENKEVCAGFTVRSWCRSADAVLEAFLTGDRRALALEDTPRPIAWQRLRKQLPLARIITQTRAGFAAAARRSGDSTARWYRAHGQRDQAQDAVRRALERAERWGETDARRRKYTPQDWRDIAAVADAAREERTPQSRAVADLFGCRNPSARDLARMRKLIQRARDYVRSTETPPEAKEEA